MHGHTRCPIKSGLNGLNKRNAQESLLNIYEEAGDLFKKSLHFAKKVGYLKSRKIKIVLDTTPIFGRGAVKDTYNILLTD
jgi:hypothetical protein